MTTLPHFPPLDGSITVLPGFADFHAANNPHRPWVVFPSSQSPTNIVSISFLEFAKATQRVAHAIRPNRQGRDGEVVALLLNCDSILYLAIIAGIIRAGLTPFPISPRNSAEAVAHLVQKTDCHRMITQDALSSLAAVVQSDLASKSYALQIGDVPSLYAIFPTLRTTPPNDNLEQEEYRPSATPPSPDDVILYLHSSGSTGFPKPIPQTHKTMLQWSQGPTLTEARDNGIRMASMALPTFHTMGIFLQLLTPLMSGQAVALYAPHAPAPPPVPNPDSILEISRLTGCSGLPAVPSFLEYWAQSPSAVEYLASLKLVTFAGGPLSTANGNKLARAGVKLLSIFGTTETGTATNGYYADSLVKSKEDWEWSTFSSMTRPRWIPQDDGTYELQFLTCETHQPAIENLPDTKGYATSDLFEPHPTKKGLWRITGRVDDVIVLGTGEKIVPIPQEGHIVSSPLVAGAVMFGRGRPQAGIIVEPHPSHIVDTSDEAGIIAFRNKIWPIVEEANASAPSFGRIFKEMIIVTEPTKPLPRAAKGTVIRKLAIASYSDSIDQLYKTIEDSADSKGISPPESWSVGDIEAWLHKHAASLNEDRELDSSADLFEAGFDSLSATFLRNRIIGALRVSNDTAVQEAVRGVSQNFIFDHPTITELATAIYTLVYPSLAPVAEKNKTKHIRDLIEKYSAGLPKRSSAVATSNKTSFVVVLTGSTGNIGSHILASLLSDERITRVYTLDRDSSSSGPWERQKFAFEDRGLPVELLSHRKLSSLVGDLNAPMFGLKPELYQEIANTVTHFIHNAWKVNFNHALNSFEAQISGTRKLLDLCFSSTRPIRVLFTSSVSVAHGWDVVNGPVPEESLPNPELAVSTGYASSKYVTEQLLTKAAENGLETTILRVGQVCGSKATGAWNVTDWVPIFVKSSLAIGCLPELEGCVSWIPMDAVADTVLDLIVSPNDPSLVLNVVHPRPSPWNDVIKAINEELRQRLPLVPYAQWIGKLEVLSADPDPQQLEDIPALKLLEFFRGIGASDSSISDKTNVEAGGMPLYETRELQRQSETARTLSPLNEDYSRMWVKYWRSKGLLL